MLYKCWILVLVIWAANGYKLNVPRLLLPYHPTIPMRFELEVGSPRGGCFKWRSNRPDIVTVAPTTPGECSDRAEVISLAKIGGTHSAVIFAEEQDGGSTLSCVVTIDEIVSTAIEHTTKVLYVDAAPAPITVTAFNADGDKFSTLGEIPFEWELSTDSNKGDFRPLRIVPFEQSKYKAPADIQELEKQRKKGYIVLLEGLSTGSSVINARFHDSHFSHVSGSSLDLVVVANLLLDPAYDVVVPVDSEVHFDVRVVKEQGFEDVSMPSPLYTLKIGDLKICELNKATSIVTAISKGTTNLWLHTENIDPKVTKNAALRPPSTKIQVVDPGSIKFSISGDNWFLEKGRLYKITLNLFDPHGNPMFIASNARFETHLPLDYFGIKETTKNGSYFEVVAMKAGRVNLHSKLRSFLLQNGIEKLLSRKVTGEQQVEIVDSIAIMPDEIMFPYIPHKHFTYNLKAIGGSGSFNWSTVDKTVCAISSDGVIRSGELGSTMVTAVDRRNVAIFGKAKVAVLEIISLDFGNSNTEVEEGQTLTLNLQLYGFDPDEPQRRFAFADCRNVPFVVEVHNSELFYHEQDAPSSIPVEGSGCGTISLRAMKAGDTRVTVRYEKLSKTIDVSAYPRPITRLVLITRQCYMALEARNKQLALSSSYPSDGATVSIQVPPAQIAKVTATGCSGWVTISEKTTTNTVNASKHFLIQMNREKIVEPENYTCQITLNNRLTGQIDVVFLTIRGPDVTPVPQLEPPEDVPEIEPMQYIKPITSEVCHRRQKPEELARTFSWLFTPLMLICVGVVLFFGVCLLLRPGTVRWGTANNYLATGVFASDRSSPNTSSLQGESYAWQESPPRYHSTPLGDTTTSSGPVGSGGSPQLWSSTNMRRRL